MAKKKTTKAPPQKKIRSDEELKKLALDYYKGLIFSDRQCRTPEDARSVFMILFFMNKKQLEALQKNPPKLIFEYYDKATPMAVNGYPTFFSCSFLSEEEFKKFAEFYDKIKGSVDEVLK
jgi:hypothetical protein